MNTKSKYLISICFCLFALACFPFYGCVNGTPTLPISNTSSPTTGVPTSSISPSIIPTTEPTIEATIDATVTASTEPTKEVTKVPTKAPVTNEPVKPKPTNPITKEPTKEPTKTPTKEPTKVPTKAPTKVPTKTPTKAPTKAPTKSPVIIPTIYSVSSPEKNTLTNSEKTVVIDISNTAKGYFSIKYSGSNKKVKAIVTKGDDSYTYDINTTNSYIYFPLQLGNGTYNIGIYENVSGKSYMPILQESFSVKVTNANSIYLYPNQYVWFNQSSKITRLSAEVCAGCDTDVEKVSAIFQYVTSNISYDYNKAKTVTSGYLPNIDNILTSKKGICFDYASVFAAMCRAQGLPCKLVTGYVPDGNTLAFHAWNQIYTKEKGYITVSFYIKPGFNTLDPTFYSTINNDEKAASKFGDGSQYQIYKVY